MNNMEAETLSPNKVVNKAEPNPDNAPARAERIRFINEITRTVALGETNSFSKDNITILVF